jgi:transcription elongation GreA/GreB family factor
MSVAFRRDVDEEQLEPRLELPIPPGPNLVTPRGLAQIEERVDELEAALAAGGSEEQVAAIRRELRYWHTRRATAQIAPPADGDEISLGSRVRYRLGGEDQTVEIVGGDEADPHAGRIAFTAPLARALMGAFEGDLVDFAGRKEAIEILSVEAIEP